jgi:DNA polymerase alpha subunit A
MAKARAAALAQLRELRASGKSRLSTYEVQDEAAIYEEVDEEGYKKVVRERLDRDDFVVDDNGDGYADDGREEWDTQRDYESSDEELGGKLGKRGVKKRKREEDEKKDRREKIAMGIGRFFSGVNNENGVKAKVSIVYVHALCEGWVWVGKISGLFCFLSLTLTNLV